MRKNELAAEILNKFIEFYKENDKYIYDISLYEFVEWLKKGNIQSIKKSKDGVGLHVCQEHYEKLIMEYEEFNTESLVPYKCVFCNNIANHWMATNQLVIGK